MQQQQIIAINKKTIIPLEEIERLKQEQINFEKEIKSNKSKYIETVEDNFRSLIKEKLFKDDGKQLQKVYIHCLKDIPTTEVFDNNKFPFKTTNDYLGITFDRKFD